MLYLITDCNQGRILQLKALLSKPNGWVGLRPSNLGADARYRHEPARDLYVEVEFFGSSFCVQSNYNSLTLVKQLAEAGEGSIDSVIDERDFLSKLRAA